MARNSGSTFFVRALWDDEAKVFVSESDIKGLHIEADTIEEFERVIFEHARELIFENHIKPKLARQSIESFFSEKLFPGIIWQRPDGVAATL
mgnify:CR=1 FL=1